MDAQDFRNLQEAYMEVYLGEGFVPPTQSKSDKMVKQSVKHHNAAMDAGGKYTEVGRKKLKQKSKVYNAASRMSDRAKEADVYKVDEANRGDEYAAAKMYPNVRMPDSLYDVKNAKEKRRNQSFDAGHTHNNAPELTKYQEKKLNTSLVRRAHTKNVRGVGTKGKGVREQSDIYDIILSHLLDEGYAETPEAAEAIMVNMSEEWRDSIIG